MTLRRANKFVLVALASGFLAACSDTDQVETRPGTSITTARAELKSISDIETSVGRLEANTAPTVAAETAGRVVEVLVEAGQRVEAGEALARLDGDTQRANHETAKGEVRQLEALSSNQQQRVTRLASLVEENLISKDQFEEAQAQAKALASQLASAQARLANAKLALDRIEIRAPVAGEIQRRHISVGDFVAVGQPVFEMVAADALQAVFPIPQRLATKIALGQSVLIHPVGLPSESLELPITEIRPEVGARSRALEVVVDLANPGLWRAGSSVVGEIVLDAFEGVVIPPGALVRRPSGEVVYVIDSAQSVAMERPVQVGLRHADWIEIISGLEPNVVIALDGAGFLTDGTPVSFGSAETADREAQ